MIDHAVDGLFVAGDDARREHDRVALFDLGVLVIVDRGARKGRHGLALGSADHHADFFRRKVLHLAGIDHEAVGNFQIAEIFGDFGRVVHRAADERDFAAVLVGQFDGQPDAVNGRGKAGDEKTPLGMREDFVKFAADGALAGRVALALDVGGILKQRQHALFAVFGKGVQIEKMIVGGSGVDLEIAGMNDDAERRVDRERNAIHQAVRDANRMNGERADFETLAGRISRRSASSSRPCSSSLSST